MLDLCLNLLKCVHFLMVMVYLLYSSSRLAKAQNEFWSTLTIVTVINSFVSRMFPIMTCEIVFVIVALLFPTNTFFMFIT